MKDKKMDRRDFLRMSSLGVAGAALAACQPQTVIVEKEVEKVVKETVVVEKEKVVEKEVEKEVMVGSNEIRYLTQTWCWEKLNMANATDHYNQELRNANAGYQIVVDPAPDGWDTKVAQMVQDNELLWNGHLRTVNIGDCTRNYKLGILQPWDEYINASTIPWAGTFWDEVLPNILESFTIDGKLYGLPWDGEVYTRVYNKMIWDTIGETPAETMDEFERQLEEIVAANPDKTAMCLRRNAGTLDAHMYMQMWTDDPVWIRDENGAYLDVQADAYKEFLVMMKRWWDKGILTPDSWGATMFDSWNTGNTATGQSGAAWLQATAQKVFGKANIIAMPNPVLNKGDVPKTLFFNNGAMLFKGAAEPQQITDWLLWMTDPTVEKLANYSFLRGHLNYYHTPVFNSVYENLLPGNADWGWMADLFEMIKASEAIPPDSWIDTIGPIIQVWEEKYVHGDVELQEAVDGMQDEFMEAVQKAVTS